MEAQEPEVTLATRAFCCLALAVLAGCSGGRPPPLDYRPEKDRVLPRTESNEIRPVGESALGSGFGAEWRKLGDPQFGAPAADPSRRNSLTAEEREFEDWRAWQEWKRRNPK